MALNTFGTKEETVEGENPLVPNPVAACPVTTAKTVILCLSVAKLLIIGCS
jgi:hypothetical protein